MHGQNAASARSRATRASGRNPRDSSQLAIDTLADESRSEQISTRPPKSSGGQRVSQHGDSDDEHTETCAYLDDLDDSLSDCGMNFQITEHDHILETISCAENYLVDAFANVDMLAPQQHAVFLHLIRALAPKLVNIANEYTYEESITESQASHIADTVEEIISVTVDKYGSLTNNPPSIDEYIAHAPTQSAGDRIANTLQGIEPRALVDAFEPFIPPLVTMAVSPFSKGLKTPFTNETFERMGVGKLQRKRQFICDTGVGKIRRRLIPPNATKDDSVDTKAVAASILATQYGASLTGTRSGKLTLGSISLDNEPVMYSLIINDADGNYIVSKNGHSTKFTLCSRLHDYHRLITDGPKELRGGSINVRMVVNSGSKRCEAEWNNYMYLHWKNSLRHVTKAVFKNEGEQGDEYFYDPDGVINKEFDNYLQSRDITLNPLDEVWIDKDNGVTSAYHTIINTL